MGTATITPRQLVATVVVAASDSKEPERASCRDTGCLDALPATGGEVFLLDGTYKV
jgi:hypothetical protein